MTDIARVFHSRADAASLAIRDHNDPFKGFAQRFDNSPLASAVQAQFPNMRADAAGGLALEKELTKYSAVLTTQKYPHLTSFELFPGAPDQPAPYDERYIVKDLIMAGGRVSNSYMDKGGAADIIVNANAALPVLPYLSHAGYTLPEIARAAAGNVPLPSWKLEACNRAINEAMNRENWFGNSTTGIVGFWGGSSGVTPTVVDNSSGGSPLWANKTPDEIINDISKMITTHVAKTKDIPELRANCLVLDPESYFVLATTLVSYTNGQRTLLEVVKQFGEAMGAGFSVERAYELATIPSGLTGAGSKGMALFRRDGMIAGRLVALPLAFLPPEVELLSTTMVGHAQAGGICVRYPVAIEQRYGM